MGAHQKPADAAKELRDIEARTADMLAAAQFKAETAQQRLISDITTTSRPLTPRPRFLFSGSPGLARGGRRPAAARRRRERLAVVVLRQGRLPLRAARRR